MILQGEILKDLMQEKQVTKKGIIYGILTVHKGVHVYIKTCPVCKTPVRFQNYLTGFHNFNNCLFLSLQLCSFITNLLKLCEFLSYDRYFLCQMKETHFMFCSRLVFHLHFDIINQKFVKNMEKHTNDKLEMSSDGRLTLSTEVITFAPSTNKAAEIPDECKEQVLPIKRFSIGQFQIHKEHKGKKVRESCMEEAIHACSYYDSSGKGQKRVTLVTTASNGNTLHLTDGITIGRVCADNEFQCNRTTATRPDTKPPAFVDVAFWTSVKKGQLPKVDKNSFKWTY
ncbi:hypothetical protein F2P81_025528 [Scophthalmus maximus]|uniref:HMG domain-containing protein n=1 Tax=Scophthalmus maximus TaxID=52904 RepID=A0A6A4RPU6_SCOMX|nr:hypothetical protein F2P81_025528 [Scophthalmus maximus]